MAETSAHNKPKTLKYKTDLNTTEIGYPNAGTNLLNLDAYLTGTLIWNGTTKIHPYTPKDIV